MDRVVTLLERYIFQAAATAFLAVLSALTGVVWITQALREFDLLTSKGQSILIFLSVTGLTIPSLIMLVAPIALFIAALYILNKLNGDSELIVMCAAGSPPWLLLRPFIVLTFLVVLLDAYMSVFAMPWSFRTLRDLLTKVRADFITRVVRPGQFTSLEQGFVFHYRERGPNGELLGVFMQDRREPDKVVSYVAEAGQTLEKGGQDYLVLDRGNVQRQTRDGSDASIIVFERYAVDLAEFGPAEEGAPLKPRERTTWELLTRDDSDAYVQRIEGRFRSELNDRFASPLYAVVAAIIAFVALGEAKTTRQGRGLALGGAILSFGLLRIAGIGASTLVVRSVGAVFLVYAIPLLSVAIGLSMIFGLPSIVFSPRLVRPLRRAEGVS
ncbi:MAG: LPS export ABC transporter permease LptF [Methylobacteriaceae bacterium]|nr:LPS export ABC transporter permease LptF [Methylobacteriaceae bacterium]